jgi:hypothetical protein
MAHDGADGARGEAAGYWAATGWARYGANAGASTISFNAAACHFAAADLLGSGRGPNRQQSETHVSSRTMIDDWNEKLQCPKCGKTGMASLSQNDDADIATVHSVPDGFKVVDSAYGPNFQCSTCDVAVSP